METDSRTRSRVLHGAAYGQAGFFTAAQAKDAGYSYQAQKYHVDHGNWVRVGRALFRLPDWPEHPHDDFVRWVLWSGSRAVVSHDSALDVHGLTDVNPARIHLTVPPGFGARHAEVRLHAATLSPEDVEPRMGFAVTTVERTILDVAGAAAPQDVIDAAVREGVESGVLSARRLRRRAAGACDRAALGVERALARLGETP